MQRIATLSQLKELQNETIVYAMIVSCLAIFIAIVTSNLIAYRGGNDRSFIKRRVLYLIIGLIAAFGFYIYNDLIVAQRIANAGFKSMFSTTNLTCLAITIVGYIITGVIIMYKGQKKTYKY